MSGVGITPIKRRDPFEEWQSPLGWVGHCTKEGFPGVVCAVINICEEDALSYELGTEAWKRWIDYLFDNMEFHKIGLETWPFNSRIMYKFIR